MMPELRCPVSSPYEMDTGLETRFTIIEEGLYEERKRESRREAKYRALDNETGCEVVWNDVSVSHCDRKRVQSILSDLQSASCLTAKHLDHILAFWFDPTDNKIVYITDSPSAEAVQHYLRKIKAPRLKVVKQWTKDLLSALHYIHSQQGGGYSHGRVSLNTILVVPSTGEVKLGGLGEAAVSGADREEGVEYCAPEVLQGKGGQPADIYALGISLLEISTLSRPYSEHPSRAQLLHHILSHTPPLCLSRILHPVLAQFISLCIAQEQTRPTAAALLSHPFLAMSDDLPESHLPIQLADATDKPRTITVVLHFMRTALKVEFDYHPGVDSSESIVKEMAEELSIPGAQLTALREAVIASLGGRLKKSLASAPDLPALLASTSDPFIRLQEQQYAELRSLRALHEQELEALLRKKKAQQSQSCCFDKNAAENRTRSSISTAFNDSKEVQCSSGSQSPQEAKEALEKPREIPIPEMQTTVVGGGAGDEADIRRVQEALNTVYGEDRTKVDGVYGCKTEALVREFQANSGLLVDGLVTKPVWKLLISKD